MRTRAKQKLASKATTSVQEFRKRNSLLMETGNISNWIIIIEKTNKEKRKL